VKINKNYDNEKIFKIIGLSILILIMAILAFSYFTSKPYLKGKRNPRTAY
jgi:hypothetical protein